jgi:hypothetical protein
MATFAKLLEYHLDRVAVGDSPMIAGKVTVYSPPAKLYPYKQDPEEQRRNLIIARLIKECPFSVGDIVRPANAETFATLGLYRITGLALSYAQYKGSSKEDDWPSNDNPMIVGAVCIKDGTNIFATTNYFVTYNGN